MALQKTITSDFGVDGNYIKIDYVSGTKDNLNLIVYLFATEQARLDGKKPLKQWHVDTLTPTGTGNDLLVDLYNHLKTLPEFSGSTDI